MGGNGEVSPGPPGQDAMLTPGEAPRLPKQVGSSSVKAGCGPEDR